MGGAVDLSLVSSGLVNPLVKGRWGPGERFEGHRANDVGDMDAPERAGEGEAADRPDGLSSVKEGEPLFGFEGERFEAALLQDFRAWLLSIAVPTFAFSDHREGQMGERSEVARGTD